MKIDEKLTENVPLKCAARAVYKSVRPVFGFFLPFFYILLILAGFLNDYFAIFTLIADIISEQTVIKTPFLMYIIVYFLLGFAFMLRSASRLPSKEIEVLHTLWERLHKLSEWTIGKCMFVVSITDNIISVSLSLGMAALLSTVTFHYCFHSERYAEQELIFLFFVVGFCVILAGLSAIVHRYLLLNFENNVEKHSIVKGVVVGFFFAFIGPGILFLALSI